MKRAASGQPRSARILFYDLETSPIIGTTWRTYDTDLVWMIEDWQILCFAYKWLDEPKTHVVSQTDFKSYKKGKLDDLHVVKKLHELFSEADYLVAHNGDQFDVKKSYARFIYHRLGPPVPSQNIDTKKMAKRYFGFSSNRLDDLGEYLGVGRKIRTDKSLWQGCLSGDMAAWNKMHRYNKQDVRLLENIYLKLLPYDTGHGNRANLEGRPGACPRCGREGFLWAQGFRYTKTGKYRRYQCQKCGSFVSSRSPEKDHDRPNYV